MKRKAAFDPLTKKVSAIAILAGSLPVAFFLFKFCSLPISNNPEHWSFVATYIAGITGTTFGLLSVILLVITLQRQTENSNLQQFEATFFSLLTNQREIFLKH